MPDDKSLTEKSKEELIRIILEQGARIRELEDAVIPALRGLPLSILMK